MRLRIVTALAAVVAFAAPAHSQYANIGGLFVTGVDASGLRLGLGADDPHYKIVETGNQAKVVNGANCRLAGSWLLPPGQSCWVWEQANGEPLNTTRTFRTTFDLTGYDASTAFISGGWATDNWGLDILINGVSTGQSIKPGDLVGFGALTNFTINSNFVAGTNTLDFVVQDFGVLSGFMVGTIEGRARLAVVPEPSSFALLGLGAVVLGGTTRRRRNS